MATQCVAHRYLDMSMDHCSLHGHYVFILCLCCAITLPGTLNAIKCYMLNKQITANKLHKLAQVTLRNTQQSAQDFTLNAEQLIALKLGNTIIVWEQDTLVMLLDSHTFVQTKARASYL
jgi:hypothetical protein